MSALVALPQTLALAIDQLNRSKGVQGVSLQHGAKLLHNNLPISDLAASDLAAQIDALFAGYRGVGRGVSRLLLGFGKNWLFVVGRGEVRLTFLLAQGSDADAVAGAANGFFAGNNAAIEGAAGARPAKPVNGANGAVPEGAVRDRFSAVLTKVIGQAQAARIIEREIAAVRGDGASGLGRPAMGRVADALLELVPNRSRRASLRTEFDAAIDALSPKHD
jgi:hypothetical protein